MQEHGQKWRQWINKLTQTKLENNRTFFNCVMLYTLLCDREWEKEIIITNYLPTYSMHFYIMLHNRHRNAYFLQEYSFILWRYFGSIIVFFFLSSCVLLFAYMQSCECVGPHNQACFRCLYLVGLNGEVGSMRLKCVC